jgi:hypothetical protein
MDVSYAHIRKCKENKNIILKYNIVSEFVFNKL